MSPEIPRGPVTPPEGPRSAGMRPREYNDPSKQDTHFSDERAYGSALHIAGNVAFLLIILAALAGISFVVYNLISS